MTHHALIRVLAFAMLFLVECVSSTQVIYKMPLILRGGGNDFQIVDEDVIHDGWRRLIRRRIRFPSALEVDFEIVAQRGTDQAVLVFVWNSQTKTATLIREYMPALHEQVHGLAAGMVEDKHADSDQSDVSQTAAEHELEEECRMAGGKWYRVTQDDSAMDKYSSTKLSVYLVIDPTEIPIDKAKPRDTTEEGMEIVNSVTIYQIWELIINGRMTVVGGWACMLAINKLKELGEVSEQ